jgi:ATP-binding cassette, subfamily B (MDR/TAP), member 1
MPDSWRDADANASSAAAKAESRGDGKRPAAAPRVPFHRLFTFADCTDVMLMVLGALGAVANGAAMPFMTVLFGNLVNAFGGALSIHDVVNRVSWVSLQFIYLAIFSAVASFARKQFNFLLLLQCADTESPRLSARACFSN